MIDQVQWFEALGACFKCGKRQLHADYDLGADVLYIALGRPREDEGEDMPDGIVLRYGADDNRPSGVTVIGYIKNGWSRNVGALAKIVTAHLSTEREQAIRVIKRAAPTNLIPSPAA